MLWDVTTESSWIESQRWCLTPKPHRNSRRVLWCKGQMRLPILQVLNRWYFLNWFKHLSYFSVLLCWGVQRFSDPSLLNETATGDAVSARPCLLWCSAIRASSCFLLCRSSSLNISCLRISDHTCYFKTYSQVTVNTGFVSALKKNRLILLLIPTKISILTLFFLHWDTHEGQNAILVIN